MLMTMLTFGAVFWIAVIGDIIKLVESDGEEAMKNYCTYECIGYRNFLNTTGDPRISNEMGNTADMVQIMTFGGNHNV